MKYNKKSSFAITAAGIALCLNMFAAGTALAGHPDKFIIRNYTTHGVNMKVNHLWSTFPAPAASATAPTENVAPWAALHVLCGPTATKCKVNFYAKTDSSDPVRIGESSLDLKTGELAPAYLSAHGFTLKCKERGVVEISGDVRD